MFGYSWEGFVWLGVWLLAWFGHLPFVSLGFTGCSGFVCLRLWSDTWTQLEDDYDCSQLPKSQSHVCVLYLNSKFTVMQSFRRSIDLKAVWSLLWKMMATHVHDIRTHPPTHTHTSWQWGSKDIARTTIYMIWNVIIISKYFSSNDEDSDVAILMIITATMTMITYDARFAACVVLPTTLVGSSFFANSAIPNLRRYS